ncbi:MAG: hypothetical protein ABI430_04065 [Candidatus Taylorbacteria bacterium]
MSEKELGQPRDIQEKAYESSIQSFFKGDNYFLFIYRKVEKILTAVYLVTNLLPDSEPLKWRLRQRLGEVLSDILAFHAGKSEVELDRALAHTIESISLLEIANKGSLIGSMNAMLIRAELHRVLETIQSGNSRKKIVLPASFFEVGLNENDVKSTERENDSITGLYKGQSKGHHVSFRLEKDTVGTGIKDNKNSGDKDQKTKDRKELIMVIVRKNKEVSIKDISASIQDCSEKTIQRDLLSMVDSGVLKKVGERRWSRYLLAHNM